MGPHRPKISDQRCLEGDRQDVDREDGRAKEPQVGHSAIREHKPFAHHHRRQPKNDQRVNDGSNDPRPKDNAVELDKGMN